MTTMKSKVTKKETTVKKIDKKLDSNYYCAIIEASGKSNVLKLEIGDFKLEFQPKHFQAERVKEIPIDEMPRMVTEQDKEVPGDMKTLEEEKKQEDFGLMLIEDASAAMDLFEKGEVGFDREDDNIGLGDKV